MPPGLGVWNLNHWTTKEVPLEVFRNIPAKSRSEKEKKRWGGWGRDKWLLSYKFRQLTTQSPACRIPGVALRSLVWHAIPHQRCCLSPNHEMKSTLNGLAFLLSTPLANWRSTDTAEILIYSELTLLWHSPFLPLLMKVISVHFYPAISMYTSNTGQQPPCAIVKNESWLSVRHVLSALWGALQDHLTRILWWTLLVLSSTGERTETSRVRTIYTFWFFFKQGL